MISSRVYTYESPPLHNAGPHEISPPVCYGAKVDSDSEEADAGAFLTLPLESPLISPRRRVRRGTGKSLIPERGGETRKEANNGFSTPVRSTDDSRLETVLTSTVHCPSPILRQICPRENTPFAITPWISCGTASYATQVERVAEDGFTHVINMCPRQMQVPPEHYLRRGINLTVVDARDTLDYPLLTRHFQECFLVAEKARQQRGKVLLHCLKAVNRSVAMAIALQIRTEGACLQEAVRRLTLLRAPVLQNSDFRRQLVHFSRNMQVCSG